MAPARASAGGCDRSSSSVRARSRSRRGAAAAPPGGASRRSARPAVCVRDLSGASSSYVNKSESRLYALEAAHERLLVSAVQVPLRQGCAGLSSTTGSLDPWGCRQTAVSMRLRAMS